MLYGTTLKGGTDDWGTVFKLSKEGAYFSVLHSFPYIGGYSAGSLAEGRDGVLYGTTFNDGGHQFGTVYSINEDGTGFTILYRFTEQEGDKWGTPVSLSIGFDGTLYGTTPQGGDSGQGTVFRLSYSPPRIVITSIELGDPGARLSLSNGAAGQTYELQASSNLPPPSWQAIGSQLADSKGMVHFLDTNATRNPARFYRVVAH
jgi:uncharacterized repeat protein (TIGR03803 family)